MPRPSNRARRGAGQSLIEYALIVAVLAIAGVSSINYLRGSLSVFYAANNQPLQSSSSELAMTPTPRYTATPTVTPTRTPVPTATPTRTPTPTPTATPTSAAPMSAPTAGGPGMALPD